MDVLAEMTRILAPPAWLNFLEITRTQVTLAGETAQAAPLLQTIDASPLFQGSEFVIPPFAREQRRSVSHPHQSGAWQMNLSPRDRRALAWLAVAVLVGLVAYFWPAE